MVGESSPSPEPEQQPRLGPFKLYFSEGPLIGKSNIEIDKPLKKVAVIAGKFYSRHDVEEDVDELLLEKKLKELEVTGPREKYRKPITESQRYGWYQIELTDTENKNDRRLHFAIKSNQFIREHLMNYAKIRDY